MLPKLLITYRTFFFLINDNLKLSMDIFLIVHIIKQKS